MVIVEVTTDSKADTLRGIFRWAGQTISALLILGAHLFLTANRLEWIPGRD